MYDALTEKNEKMKKTDMFLVIFLFAMVIASPIYTFYTKSIEDYKFIALFIGTIFFVMVSLILKPRKRSECDTEEEYEEDIDKFTNFFLFGAIPLIPIAGFLYYSILNSVIDLFIFLYSLSSPYLQPTLPAILAITIGYLLFQFRLRYRVMYGLSEVIVGALAGVLHASNGGQLDKPEFYLAILSASIYLIVRGLDNMSIGIKNSPNNTLLNKVLGHQTWIDRK